MRTVLFTIFVVIAKLALSQTNLMDVKPWAYQLQDISIDEIASNSSFELIVIDYSQDGTDEQKFSNQQIQQIRQSGKYAVAYISIGEAENYRYYWQDNWNTNTPPWLGLENPDWEGNFKVRFWYPEWQQIVFDYVDTIVAQGFDGIYMDIIDAYWYWMEENPEQSQADSLMCQFVINLREHVNIVTGNSDFVLIPQNGEAVWDQGNVSAGLKQQYFNSINAIGVEDVFFPGDLDENNEYDPDDYRLNIIQDYLANQKQVYSIDYLTDNEKLVQYIEAASLNNYVPYACVRELNQLCDGIELSVETYQNDNPAIKLSYDKQSRAITFYLENKFSDKISAVSVYDIMGSRIHHMEFGNQGVSSGSLSIESKANIVIVIVQTSSGKLLQQKLFLH